MIIFWDIYVKTNFVGKRINKTIMRMLNWKIENTLKEVKADDSKFNCPVNSFAN